MLEISNVENRSFFMPAHHFMTTFLKHFKKSSNPTISIFNPLIMVHPSSFCYGLYLQKKEKFQDSEAMQLITSRYKTRDGGTKL